jgi:hypothetical protein
LELFQLIGSPGAIIFAHVSFSSYFLKVFNSNRHFFNRYNIIFLIIFSFI